MISEIEGLHCMVDFNAPFCRIICACRAFSMIPETLQGGTLAVRAISDRFLWYCQSCSIQIPCFIEEVFGPPAGDRQLISRLDIPASIKSVHQRAFYGCSSLTRVVFAPNTQIHFIDGIWHCPSLFRIEIPASVEIIGDTGFLGCPKLSEVEFARDSRLRDIRGFRDCGSLCRIEIPLRSFRDSMDVNCFEKSDSQRIADFARLVDLTSARWSAE
jgi:hypothetical protein